MIVVNMTKKEMLKIFNEHACEKKEYGNKFYEVLLKDSYAMGLSL